MVRPYKFVAIVLLAGALTVAAADTKTSSGAQPISKETRMLVIRSLNAETVFVRKILPHGEVPVILRDGLIQNGKELDAQLLKFGPAAKPGDRAQITDIVIKDKTILIDLNGGPKKKTKWYQHIQVGMGAGTHSIGPADDGKVAQGTRIELQFEKFVPEMTGDQVRTLLSSVLDFKAKSAVEAYLDTVPPQVKKAITDHQVLVGMNRDMVVYAKGRPTKKVRETDSSGTAYEEWMYGEPPAEVQFVRFVGDEVVQLKIMQVDGRKVVRNQREITLPGAQEARKVDVPVNVDQPAGAPTLRRPGEADPDAPIKRPVDPKAKTAPEPEWGTQQPKKPDTPPPTPPPPGGTN